MSKEKVFSENRKSANTYREKTHFFILGLIFTTLAYSIQTAKFQGSLVSQICELIAWLYLAISGFSELFILMIYPKHLNLVAKKQEIETIASEERISENTKTDLENTNKFITRIENTIKNIWLIHIWFGIFGFVSLMIARGYDPFINIFW